MQELTMAEVAEVSGGKIPWILVLNAFSDFCEGFSDGYKASQK